MVQNEVCAAMVAAQEKHCKGLGFGSMHYTTLEPELKQSLLMFMYRSGPVSRNNMLEPISGNDI